MRLASGGRGGPCAGVCVSLCVRWLLAVSCVACAVIDSNEATDSEFTALSTFSASLPLSLSLSLSLSSCALAANCVSMRFSALGNRLPRSNWLAVPAFSEQLASTGDREASLDYIFGVVSICCYTVPCSESVLEFAHVSLLSRT